MLAKSELVGQANLAFEFIQKLYLEVSYLVKEIEGILSEQDEKFTIGRPSGYGISAKSSTGLETNYVNFWLLRKFAVFFVPKNQTKVKGGQTWTEIDNNLKILYLRILLNDDTIDEPKIFSGVFFNMENKYQPKWTKFESFMSHFEYNDAKIFKEIRKIKYEDAYSKLQGELIVNNLFEVNDTETIVNKVVNPSLALFRKY